MDNSDGFLVMAERCDTCIFRPGNPMNLNPGRVKGMVADCLRDNSHIACHKSPSVTGEGDLAVACRGFIDKWPYVSISQRLGDMLGRVIEVDPETLERVS